MALEDFCFWPKAMSAPAPGHIDPVTVAKVISPQDSVATMGSCFAQHLAKHISKSGLDYFVAEQAPAGMTEKEAQEKNYGVFSARYGNIYTVRQAVQLFDRSFGNFQPVERAWERPDGRWVDAFRPQIEPDGFESPEEVDQAAAEHLSHVREVFTKCKWLVLTLGLTEGWISKIDGAVYPLAPGVKGGSYEPERHAFINFSLTEVWEDLDAFISKVRSVNPEVQFLLTVSPVSLMATYERRHVLSSTVCSKSILRVAADQAERKYPCVIYFPSYEIITSPAAGSRYYEDDLRQVTELGVSHVMRLFSRHFIEESRERLPLPEIELDSGSADIVCDEEVIQDAIRDSGLRAQPKNKK
ncbi:MAG: GSCFA domain-containing protein [Gammaproteobacteria bacterium]|nr:GSCFA domain-containing protein [Gammaproteobacteria bacterium]MBU1777820.1 GSCFA domain-containing protein [Gammaproteobacteria bacterium]